MNESSSSYSRPKYKGYYETTYKGINGVPRGFTAHEYMRICNCLPKLGVLRRNWLSTMLRRNIGFQDFTYLVNYLQRDGRLKGYEALPAPKVTKRKRRLKPSGPGCPRSP